MTLKSAYLLGLLVLSFALLTTTLLSGCATDDRPDRLAAARVAEERATVARRALATAREQLTVALPAMPKECKDKILYDAQGDDPLDLLVLRADAALSKSNARADWCYEWYGKVRAAFSEGSSDAR